MCKSKSMEKTVEKIDNRVRELNLFWDIHLNDFPNVRKELRKHALRKLDGYEKRIRRLFRLREHAAAG